MKHFYRYLLAALCIILMAIPFAMVTVHGASYQEPVIFISDNGTGDGSSPESPLKAEVRFENPHNDTASDAYKYWFCRTTDDQFYQNSVLYQAVEKLASTGGRIVLVGDVKIGYSVTLSSSSLTDRDFYLPEYGDNEIIITSSYNGTDYGAGIFLTEGGRITLNGKTKFENIKFKTGQTAGTADASGKQTGKYYENRSISCNGYPTVFGEGIVSEYYTYKDGVTAKSTTYYTPNFISISGSTRFSNSRYNTDVTVNSGTWRSVYGASWGLSTLYKYSHVGNTKITINGGTFYGDIIGTNREGTGNTFDGNIDITINGGTFGRNATANAGYGNIYATNAVGVMSNLLKATIVITGGKFNSPDKTLVQCCYKTTTPKLSAPSVTLDISSITDDATSSAILSKTEAGINVVYPHKWFKTATVAELPENNFCFTGETFDGSGLSINATYEYNGNTYSSRVNYADIPSVFSFDADTSSAGNKSMTYKFNGTAFYTGNINVIAIPVPVILGAQIKTGDANEALRFVAGVEKTYGTNITVTDYGFIALPSEYKPSDGITFETVKGATEITAKGQTFRPEYGTAYNSDKHFTFSGIYPDIPLQDFNKTVSASSYITFSYNGNTYTKYSDISEKSVLEVANKAMNSLAETKATKSWIQTNILDAYNNYSATTLYNENNANALRNIVENSFNEYSKFSWMWGDYHKRDLKFQTTSNTTTTYQTSGTTTTRRHTGMIYVSGKSSTIEEFKASTYKLGSITYYNGAMTDMTDKTLTELTPAVDFHVIPNVWNKVTTKGVNINLLSDFFPSEKTGVVTVGNYDCSSAKGNTQNVVTANGNQTMYEAYAAAKKADALFTYTPSARSIYFITSVSVVRNSDGTVNPTSSKINYSYIDSTTTGSTTNFTHFKTSSKTFSAAYSANMIPVTVPELSTGLSSQTTTVLTGFDGYTSIKSGYLTGKVQSNRHIISINVTVSRDTADNGTVNIYDETIYLNTSNTTDIYSFDLGSYFNITNPVKNFVAGKTYKINVSANVANEKTKTLVSWEYTAPELDLGSQFAKYETFDVQSDVRGSAVDAMYAMSQIEWTPEHDFSIHGEGYIDWEFTANYKAGTKYKGVIYSHQRANLLKFSKTLVNGKLTYQTQVYNWEDILGNSCSTSMYQAMQLASRIPGTGFRSNTNTLTVGNYKDPGQLHLEYTGDICNHYRDYAMYETYAQVKKGDMLYRNTANGGHTRMAYADAHVVRNSNGTINENSSYICMIEQTDRFMSIEAAKSNGKDVHYTGAYDSTWWVNVKYTFKELYDNRCVFYTTTEMLTNESEMPYIGLTHTTDNMTIGNSAEFNGSVESNYPINDVLVEIKDSNGNTVKSNLITNQSALFSTSLKMLSIDTTDLPSGTYDFVLTVGIAAGERELQRVTITK